MYFRIRTSEEEAPELGTADGRFVLHRHQDARGAHRDLRLEVGDFLLGWRIAGPLEGPVYEDRLAEAKAPHPTHWLDMPGPAEVEDQGFYRWLDGKPGTGRLLLTGREGNAVIRIEAEAVCPQQVQAVLDAARAANATLEDAPALVADGQRARVRAIARLCGLGRELDGRAFDETVWRKALERLTLDEIHRHLEAFEMRFDAKYPPQAVSRPEALPEEGTGDGGEQRRAEAQAILRGY